MLLRLLLLVVMMLFCFWGAMDQKRLPPMALLNDENHFAGQCCRVRPGS